MTHPAQFSKPIVTTIRDILLAEYPDPFGRPVVHDSFAGGGERLAEICTTPDAMGFLYSGTEIEKSFIVNPAIIHGSALDPSTYPPVRFPNEVATSGWVEVTSPVYPNGMADHAVSNDASKRYTYRKAIEQIEGEDRALHPDNMARYGYRGTLRDGKSERRKRYWEIADGAVRHWSTARLVIVNVSDFISTRNGVEHVEPVVDDWADLLQRHGWGRQARFPVRTARMGNGANRDSRVEAEIVIVAKRS